MNKETINILNEEDLKQKVILPYVDSLGFSLEELELEKSFSIRLGRNSYCLNKKKERKMAGGRLDILCKSCDKNLFVIEVKADSVDITQDDIDQGISYARLLDSIAPFVLITNGKETIVIDTISKKELNGTDIALQSQFWSNNCQLSSEEEIKFRYEALKKFIGYSLKNITIFSQAQIKDRISVLKGSKEDLTKKYIPELFLEKEHLVDSFKEFLNSSKSVFAIVGESGVGKTNQICNLAEKITSDCIALFYNGSNTHIPVIKRIKDDFNWVFSPNLKENEIFKRLSYLANLSNTNVVIFIDAIDEIPYKSRKFDLNNLCEKINLFKNIKLCVTCKQNEWGEFLKVRDISSTFKESLYQVGFNEEEPWYTLGYFTNEELATLNQKYKNIFNYKGNIDRELKKDCKLGFMLRVVAEVYSGKKLPDKINDIDLLREYLNKKIIKMSDNSSKIAKSVLITLGKCIIEEENKENSFSGKVDENKLKEKLGLSVLEQIPRELFSFNILTQDELDSGVIVVGFYYERLRDFVISVLSFKLPHINGDNFKKIIFKMLKGSAGKDALKWYIPNASLSQRNLMLQCKKRQAKLLLNNYISIIDSNCANIKDKFEPKTLGEIGIAITDNKSPFIDGYGFRKKNEEENDVIVIERGENGRDFFKYGVNLVVGSSGYLSPVLQSQKSVIDQLEKIIKSGFLEEKNNINLLIEKTLGIIYYHGKELGIEKPKDYFLPRYNEILPVDLNDIIKKIKLFNAKKYYKEKQMKELIDLGKIEVKKDGNYTSMSYSDSVFDYNAINEKAFAAINNNKEFPFPNSYGDFPPYGLLYFYINQLKNKGINYLDKPLLPQPDIPINEINNKIRERGGEQNYIPDIIIAQFSDEQLNKYVKKFFQIFVEEYNNLIETCFPTLKNNMRFYWSQPFNFFIKCSTDNLKNSWSLCYIYEESDKKKNNIEVDLNTELTKYFFHYSSIETLFNVSRPRNISSQFNMRKVNEFSVLRNWVYDQIEEDLKQIKDMFEFDMLLK